MYRLKIFGVAIQPGALMQGDHARRSCIAERTGTLDQLDIAIARVSLL